MKQPKSYTMQTEYEREIEPLLDELTQRLNALDIPFAYMAQIADDDTRSRNHVITHVDSTKRPIGDKVRIVGDLIATNNPKDFYETLKKYAIKVALADLLGD